MSSDAAANPTATRSAAFRFAWKKDRLGKYIDQLRAANSNNFDRSRAKARKALTQMANVKESPASTPGSYRARSLWHFWGRGLRIIYRGMTLNRVGVLDRNSPATLAVDILPNMFIAGVVLPTALALHVEGSWTGYRHGPLHQLSAKWGPELSRTWGCHCLRRGGSCKKNTRLCSVLTARPELGTLSGRRREVKQ